MLPWYDRPYMLLFSKRIGIDLGTANSLVWAQGRGVVLNEPTVVAVSLKDNKVVAVGERARNMLGRTPDTILTSKPLRNGVIADYSITEAMLRAFLQQVAGKSFFFRPEVMISVPAGSTPVERRAVLDATLSAGARTAYLIDDPLAAIIGAGVPIAEASGNMVVDIGGGVAEAAVVSLGGVVAGKSVRVGGHTLDEAIVKYVRKMYGVIIGDQTAEAVKIAIGTAIEEGREKEVGGIVGTDDGRENRQTAAQNSMEVKGRDAVQGMPKELTLTSEEIARAIQKPLQQIVDMIKKVLEEVPPELASDIIDKGIVLTGGTALLRNLDRYLSEHIGVPISVAEEPMLCVIKGIGAVLDHLETYMHAVQTKG